MVMKLLGLGARSASRQKRRKVILAASATATSDRGSRIREAARACCAAIRNNNISASRCSGDDAEPQAVFGRQQQPDANQHRRPQHPQSPEGSCGQCAGGVPAPRGCVHDSAVGDSSRLHAEKLMNSSDASAASFGAGMLSPPEYCPCSPRVPITSSSSQP